MSKHANPTLIGSFAVGAIALVAGALMIFGGRQFFAEHHRFVTYFQGSVKGLRVGSNVVFRGVRIGYVTDIHLVGDPKMTDFSIPVTFEVLPGAIGVKKNGGIVQAMASSVGATAQTLVAAGLRAQLDVESFVTGQLIINLDMHPEQPAVFRGVNPPYPEIPSIPSGIQMALEKLQKFLTVIQNEVPVEQIVGELQGVLHGLNRLANSPDLEASLAGLNRLVNGADTQRLPASFNGVLAELRGAVADTRRLLGQANQKIEPLAASLDQTLGQLNRTLAGGEKLFGSAGDELRADSEVAYQLKTTLRELETAARSLRNLTDYLEQHPESLIRGKSAPREERRR
jgi:paraquat-inducible protein B